MALIEGNLFYEGGRWCATSIEGQRCLAEAGVEVVHSVLDGKIFVNLNSLARAIGADPETIDTMLTQLQQEFGKGIAKRLSSERVNGVNGKRAGTPKEFIR
jgi:hypothetical protein